MLLALAACGGPVLQDAPHPNPAHVAAAAAGTAAAMTLADPDAAARKQEENKPEPDNRGQEVTETVPIDVLDRAEAARATADPP